MAEDRESERKDLSREGDRPSTPEGTDSQRGTVRDAPTTDSEVVSGSRVSLTPSPLSPDVVDGPRPGLSRCFSGRAETSTGRRCVCGGGPRWARGLGPGEPRRGRAGTRRRSPRVKRKEEGRPEGGSPSDRGGRTLPGSPLALRPFCAGPARHFAPLTQTPPVLLPSPPAPGVRPPTGRPGRASDPPKNPPVIAVNPPSEAGAARKKGARRNLGHPRTGNRSGRDRTRGRGREGKKKDEGRRSRTRLGAEGRKKSPHCGAGAGAGGRAQNARGLRHPPRGRPQSGDPRHARENRAPKDLRDRRPRLRSESHRRLRRSLTSRLRRRLGSNLGYKRARRSSRLWRGSNGNPINMKGGRVRKRKRRK